MQKNTVTLHRKSLIDILAEDGKGNTEPSPRETLLRWQKTSEMFPGKNERLVGFTNGGKMDGTMVEIMQSMNDGFYFYGYIDAKTGDACAGYRPVRGEMFKEIFAVQGMDIETIAEWQVHSAADPTKYNPLIDKSEYKRLYSGEIQ